VDESTLRTLLGDVADTPSPPIAVDIDRARAAGRRSRWRRRAAASCLVALVVLVSTTLAVSIVRRIAPASVHPRPGVTEHVQFGWLPDGAQTDLVECMLNTRLLHIIVLSDPGTIDLSVEGGCDAPGPQLSVGSAHGPLPYATATSPVNGHRAVGVAGHASILQWEYRPDEWATVSVSSQTDGSPVARHIATSLRYDDTTLRMPIELPNRRAGLTLAGVSLSPRTATYWSATLDLQSLAGRLLLTVSRPSAGRTEQSGYVDTTVDGHPAISNGSPPTTMVVYGVDKAVDVEMQIDPQLARTIPLTGVLHSLTIRLDPKTWR
jgi:hypothetical protein